MKDIIFYFFGNAVIFYTAALVLCYIIMSIASFVSTTYNRTIYIEKHDLEALNSSPFTPGVSIVSPAYNEELNIVDNVNSFLMQNYPKFEVIIVNDGSKDQTLEKLIENFELMEVPYRYNELIHAAPFKRLFRSTNPKYHRLTVVDKVNGGTKADAINAGINVARYPWFVNTDVDCILPVNAIYRCINVVLRHRNVTAISAAMTMSNGCTVKDGQIQHRRCSWSPLPMFQTLEYMRSFFLGKMAWSTINALPNVSGGFGFLNTKAVIEAGGYDGSSFAEDMEMLLSLLRYTHDNDKPYRVIQIPYTACWTEGPSTLKILYRQRKRWASGLVQCLRQHSDLIGKPRYGLTGMITLPYMVLFELLAPIIEFSGFLFTIYLAFIGAVNWQTAIVIFASIYLFSFSVNMVVMVIDWICGSTFDRKREYIKCVVAAVLEPIVYHPIIVYCSIRGYLFMLMGKELKWGEMTRRRHQGAQATDGETASGEKGEQAEQTQEQTQTTQPSSEA